MIIFTVFMVPLLCGVFDVFAFFFIGHSVLVNWTDSRIAIAGASTIVALLTCEGMQ